LATKTEVFAMRITLEGISHEALAGVTALVNSKDNDLNNVLADHNYNYRNKREAMMSLVDLDIHSTDDQGTIFTVIVDIKEAAQSRQGEPIPVLRKYVDELLDSLQVFPKEVNIPK